MKIIVAIKQVPERDAQLAIAPGSKWIDDADLAYTINEPDAYALEEALQLKEKTWRRGDRPLRRPRPRRLHPARSARQGRRPRHPHPG